MFHQSFSTPLTHPQLFSHTWICKAQRRTRWPRPCRARRTGNDVGIAESGFQESQPPTPRSAFTPAGHLPEHLLRTRRSHVWASAFLLLPGFLEVCLRAADKKGVYQRSEWLKLGCVFRRNVYKRRFGGYNDYWQQRFRFILMWCVLFRLGSLFRGR